LNKFISIATAVFTIAAAAVLLPIEASAASASTSLNFNNIGSYAYYHLKCSALVLSGTNAINLQVSEDNGVTYKASNYKWDLKYTNTGSASMTITNNTSDVGMRVGGGGTSAPGTSIDVTFNNLTSSLVTKPALFVQDQYDGTDYYSANGVGVYTGDTGAINALRIIPGSGTITTGQCSLYGYGS